MLTSAVESWCRRAGFPPSKVLLPLSYATMLGGMCTLVGTSTNLCRRIGTRPSGAAAAGPAHPRLGRHPCRRLGPALPSHAWPVTAALPGGRDRAGSRYP
ncbi:SLC13 family permease [Frateuria edaphi]|uniref:SLC13 family permease n=1 Tax=Frateuria edaphi TaxID=2898793 RepID=UPI003CE4EFB0